MGRGTERGRGAPWSLNHWLVVPELGQSVQANHNRRRVETNGHVRSFPANPIPAPVPPNRSLAAWLQRTSKPVETLRLRLRVTRRCCCCCHGRWWWCWWWWCWRHPRSGKVSVRPRVLRARLIPLRRRANSIQCVQEPMTAREAATRGSLFP